MKKMIDVSYHNGNIDFNKVKASGIEGVIIRAGYGLNTVDKQFKNNIVKASAAGLHIGIYWFSYACNTTQALAEARMCLNTIAAYKNNIDLPIFFDWEYDSYKYATKRGFNPTKANITTLCDVFCKEIANNGYFSYTINDLFYDDTIKYFRDLGYKVTEGIGWTRIEWE